MTPELQTASRTAAAGCPRRRPGLVARRIDGETLVLDRSRRLVHQLNETASYIFHRCDGRHTVAAIAGLLLEEFIVPPDTARRDVTAAVSRLEALGLIETGPS